MWLYFLNKLRWIVLSVAVFLIVAGIIMLFRDISDIRGWLLAFFGFLQFILQYYFWKHSKETDPIDTIM